MMVTEQLKEIVKRNKSSKNIFIRCSISVMYLLKDIYSSIRKLFSDSDFRSILLTQLTNSKNIHQTTSLTFMNRYPHIFYACREYFKKKNTIKILSFGCSTGEEVLTLRKYFPNASIIGTDINKHSLSIAKKLPTDDKIQFLYSNNSLLEKHGPFDAIFCMAVLQRKPHVIAQKGISDLKNIYPFEKFEQQIIELDKLLKPSGLLVVHYTQYSLLDTDIANNYKPLGDFNQNDYCLPVFDKNSKVIKNPSSQNTIFIKSNIV